MDRETRHNSQLIGARRRIDRKISAAIRSPMEWFTDREIAQKGKTRIVHYAAGAGTISTHDVHTYTHTRARSRCECMHAARWKFVGQIRPLFPVGSLFFFLFSLRAHLGIYCFNLPWPCLIMESSFWLATACQRPDRLSRRFCVFTLRQRVWESLFRESFTDPNNVFAVTL